jgi:nicotinamidase-related amidase
MPTIQVNAATTALILIDLQPAVTSRDTKPYSAASVVKKGADLAAMFRSKGAMVVLVHVDLANFVQVTADQPMRDPNAAPPPASASELVPELNRQPSDIIITKRYWDAFPGTPLEQTLRERNIRTILFAGIATNFGVESTARTAAALGFDVVIVEDATTSMSAEAHEFAVKNIFPRLGRVRQMDQITLS